MIDIKKSRLVMMRWKDKPLWPILLIQYFVSSFRVSVFILCNVFFLVEISMLVISSSLTAAQRSLFSSSSSLIVESINRSSWTISGPRNIYIFLYTSNLLYRLCYFLINLMQSYVDNLRMITRLKSKSKSHTSC